MLTRMIIRNFKRFGDVVIELGNPVIFIGPNNSGKTTALQALTLWEIAVRRWFEKRKDSKASKRRGVSINRKDILAAPVPHSKSFWRNLHVRTTKKSGGTQNIRIDIAVEGVTGSKPWRCGFEFDYQGEEFLLFRPLRNEGFEDAAVEGAQAMEIPDEARNVRIAFLPPMSGLASNEDRLDTGAIRRKIGEGLTAHVLRNLCYSILFPSNGQEIEFEPHETWDLLVRDMEDLFGVKIQVPEYVAERGEITMQYKDQDGLTLDIGMAGRGMQQTLLLLSYLLANPGSVLLLDEPDAHLEILRQRQIYRRITEVAQRQNSQIIAATHSEVVLGEAADRDLVVAFIGQPHRMDDRSQLVKSLKEIGYDQYYLAELTGWVLYLEGATDLRILQSLAETLNHPSLEALQSPFVHYVANNPIQAKHHFFGLREAKRDLVAFALFDRLDKNLESAPALYQYMWKRKEIENYICSEDTLMQYASYAEEWDLFTESEIRRKREAMQETIAEKTAALKALKKPTLESPDLKVTDDFLDPLFDDYFGKLGLENMLRKSDYHKLARFVPKKTIDEEVVAVLDKIFEIFKSARPRG